MNPLQIILAVVIALLGYPIGLIIAKFTPEELRSGRKWFKLIIFFSLVLIVLTLILFLGQPIVLMFLLSMLGFIFLLALASFIMLKKHKFFGMPKTRTFSSKSRKVRK